MALSSPGFGQGSKKAKAQKKTPPKSADVVKTRGQQQGGPGAFGSTYSIKGGMADFNISLDKAWYDIAFPEGDTFFPVTTEKFFYTRWSFKNTAPGTQWVRPEAISVSLVFADGSTKDSVLYFYRLSDFKRLEELDFKPGQGINDAIGIAVVPADARITKIILNTGRAFVPNEQVIRYFIVGGGSDATPDPKNVIAPVPAVWRDPKDPFGAKTLTDIPASLGTEYFISRFAGTVEGFAVANSFAGIKANDDQQLVIATIKIRNATATKFSFNQIGLRAGMEATIVDGDGETASFTSQFYKASREEPVGEHDINPGESYRIRVVFSVPKITKPLKSIRLREDEFKSRGLIFDASKLTAGH